jgi:hypothetical protein
MPRCQNVANCMESPPKSPPKEFKRPTVWKLPKLPQELPEQFPSWNEIRPYGIEAFQRIVTPAFAGHLDMTKLIDGALVRAEGYYVRGIESGNIQKFRSWFNEKCRSAARDERKDLLGTRREEEQPTFVDTEVQPGVLSREVEKQQNLSVRESARELHRKIQEQIVQWATAPLLFASGADGPYDYDRDQPIWDHMFECQACTSLFRKIRDKFYDINRTATPAQNPDFPEQGRLISILENLSISPMGPTPRDPFLAETFKANLERLVRVPVPSPELSEHYAEVIDSILGEIGESMAQTDPEAFLRWYKHYLPEDFEHWYSDAMQKESAPTLEQVIQLADQLSFADRAALSEHLRKKALEDFQRLQKKAAEEFEAQKNELEQSMRLFGIGGTVQAKTKAAPKAEKTGPCPICKFETIPYHDGHQHRFQGKDKKPMTDDRLNEQGYKKKTA